MKTCLDTLILVPAILGLALTVVYHASMDADLKFEERDTNAQYINTERSYRPAQHQDAVKPQQQGDTKPAAAETPKP